jgi:hypothetical protein
MKEKKKGREKIERLTLARPSSGNGGAASSSAAPARHKASSAKTIWHLSLQTGLAWSVRTIKITALQSKLSQMTILRTRRRGKDNKLIRLVTHSA